MNKRKSIVISLGISVLLIGVVASSYAYFQAVISNGSSTATSVSAKTIDGLTFSIDGGDIH